MKLIAAILFVLALSLPEAAVPQDGPANALSEGMVNPGYHDKPGWFKESFLDIREDVEEATAAGKRLLLYFYQDGCPYCAKLLNDTFGNRVITEKTRSGFDVIAINMWGDREVTDLSGGATTEKAFAAALRVQYTPTLLFLDEQGKVVLRINGYFAPHKFDLALDFVAGRHEQTGGFRDFYAAASPVAANAGLNPFVGALPEPLRLDRRGDSGRPLLVLFEQGSCADCDEPHRDILVREGIATALSNLDVAQVDLWSSDRLWTPSCTLVAPSRRRATTESASISSGRVSRDRPTQRTAARSFAACAASSCSQVEPCAGSTSASRCRRRCSETTAL